MIFGDYDLDALDLLRYVVRSVLFAIAADESFEAIDGESGRTRFIVSEEEAVRREIV